MDELWKRAAQCSLVPELPWIAEPQNRSEVAEAMMRGVCRACSARADCEAYVERTGVVSGFWAGRDRTPRPEASEEGGAA